MLKRGGALSDGEGRILMRSTSARSVMPLLGYECVFMVRVAAQVHIRPEVTLVCSLFNVCSLLRRCVLSCGVIFVPRLFDEPYIAVLCTTQYLNISVLLFLFPVRWCR